MDCFEFIEERFGKEALDAVSDPRVRATLGLPLDSISVSHWYPMVGYTRLLEWTTDHFLDAEPQRCTEIGAFAVARDFRGVYRAFLLAKRMDFFLRMAPGIWSFYQDFGRLKVLERAPKHCVFEIADFSSPSIHLRYAAVGGTARALELLGAKQISSQILSGIGDGSLRLAYRCDWS